MSAKRKKKGGRYTTPLSAHQRQGQRRVPPLLAIDEMRTVSWVKDMLPDFIWMCGHIGDDPDKGLYAVAQVLDAVDDVLVAHQVDVAFYGRLTQFEEIPDEVRAPILDALQAQGIYHHAFPESFAHALGMYPGAPGSWLIEPWLRRGLSVDPVEAERFLSEIVVKSHNGQDLVPTRVKFMYLRGVAKAGYLKIAPELKFGDYLSRYPEHISEEERREAEPSIRAAFLAMVNNGGADSPDQARLNWSRRFWRSNWSIYACVKTEALFDDSPSLPDRDAASAIFSGLRKSSADLRARFEEVALRVDPDLYAPDRYEVLTGITARVLRLVDGAVTSPLLWASEYGAGLIRSIIEAKILVRWLGAKNDDALYTRFKSYGRGKLKLLKLHTEEYLDSLDEVPEHLDDYLERLNQEVNEDLWEEWQDISVESTFSGVSARQMAIEVGLKSDYDFVFAPASGEAHGDWTSLDRHALARCQNPLHMWHRIPDFDLHSLVDPAGMEVALAMASQVVEEYIGAMGTTSTGSGQTESV